MCWGLKFVQNYCTLFAMHSLPNLFATQTIASSRQNLAAVISAAQEQPQIITRHDKPVAIVVSPEYFQNASGSASASGGFFSQLMQARQQFASTDNAGLKGRVPSRKSSWQRSNPFADSSE